MTALSADSATGPKRALVLPGGGMRVAYQAGALLAFEEAGLAFHHADGTSGGGLNLAMLLSGLTPREMCNRWRTLNVHDFAALLPLDEYLRPLKLRGLGGSQNILSRVIPHLGIDIDRVRSAQGMTAAFNVCNFSRKVNVVIPHERMDSEMLVAGMSLPIFLPALRRDGAFYTDSAFLQDANLMDCVKRGCEELWVIWCIGNTSEYRGGPFRQYVHILEMAANGALFEEMERIEEINERIRKGEPVYGLTRPVRLHMIRPEYPLPLDPEYFLGNIDGISLVSMGYRDAAEYLRQAKPEGVPMTPESTAMRNETLGLTFHETMKGSFALGETDPKAGARCGKDQKTELAMHATVLIQDLNRFVDVKDHPGNLSGTIDFAPFGTSIPSYSGVFNLFSPSDDPKMKYMVYELGFHHDGKDYYLAGKKEVRDDFGFDLWSDTTTLYTRLHEGRDTTGPVVGAGVLTLGMTELMNLISTVRVLNASSPEESAEAVAKFGKFFMGELWNGYLRQAAGRQS